MKITHIRIRVLRSRPVGYGHDAAEIEAQLEDGEDPDVVAAELRRRCETEVRQGAEQSRLIGTLDELRSEVAREERRLEALKSDLDAASKALRECEQIGDSTRKNGIELPRGVADILLPF